MVKELNQKHRKKNISNSRFHQVQMKKNPKFIKNQIHMENGKKLNKKLNLMRR